MKLGRNEVVEVGIISRTLTETLIILDIKKTEPNNCFLLNKQKNEIHVFASLLTASNTKRANLT